MDIEFFRSYCLSKQGVTEHTPFGPDTLVFKLGDKMFALFSINSFESVNLKCNPEKAIELRSSYLAVSPGYHMNKKHWNTISFNSDMKDEEILEWVDHSYESVFKSLPKRLQLEIKS